jgi:hypothetical protein
VSQRLNSYFAASPELRQMSGKIGQLQALQRLYEQIAPASLLRFSRVLKMEKRIMTLTANNGAIAAKLRQLAPELTNQLRDKGYEVTGILVRVQVTLPITEHRPASISLSSTGRQHLLELAVELADSPLKSVLQRFAQKSGQKHGEK